MNSINSDNLPIWVQKRDLFLKSNEKVKWRYNEKPDYSWSDQKLAVESKYNHPQYSLADIIQNLVRSFDIEANFKIDSTQWSTIVQDKFYLSTNGGYKYKVEDLIKSGTYKLLIGDTQYYRASEENFETSTNLFHSAFPNGFLWEVIEVYSGPPNIVFKWRHWGDFKGKYKDYLPTGNRIEVIGITVVNVTEDLKILSLENYYDNNNFLDQLTAGKKSTDSSQEKQIDNSAKTFTSLQQKFFNFLRRFFVRKQITKHSSISSCPFATLLK